MDEWYRGLPPITKTYLTGICLTTILASVDLISPYSLYYNYHLVVHKTQLWRLFTNFFFFGSLGIDVIFHLFFLMRYLRLLEDQFFRLNPAGLVYMLLFGGVLSLLVAPFASLHFLGPSLTFMIVYVWSRRNPHVMMNFMGFMNFRAPYLVYVLLAFTVLFNNMNALVTDAVGLLIGHLYFYLEDVFPYPPGRRRPRPLRTPRILEMLCSHIQPEVDPDALAAEAVADAADAAQAAQGPDAPAAQG